MKKANKSALYNTIKSTIKKLGISTEDTTGIVNYIKFMENSVPSETESTSLSRKGNSTREVVLSVLSEDSNKPFSIQDIADATGFKYPKVQILLKELKKSRKVKIVDYVPGSYGPSKVLYQTWKSPLKALKLVTEKQGYNTINGFIKGNKKLLAKGIGAASFASAVENAGLTSYPLSLSIGIARGYKNSDLKEIALGDKKRSKKVKTPKGKRKYTKRVKPEVISAEIGQKKSLSIFSIFKKKNSTSDLIKF